MNNDGLNDLLQAYKNAPEVYHVTSYWSSYEKQILDTINHLDLDQLRSGKYPILATFGFSDVVYSYHPNLPRRQKLKKKFLKWINRQFIKNKAIFPYDTNLRQIRELAYHHCELSSNLNHAKTINTIEASTFGNPEDIFEVNDKKYTLPFLNYYLRYCFAQKYIDFRGDEVVVELGSGSGYQIEILKKLYPDMTILCFDLPAQIFLCEHYLAQALGEKNIVGTNTTLKWDSLSDLQKGKVHFLGNWQIPLLKNVQVDVFWNAASFGEMEPEIVENYLKYIKGNARWIYLLQARHGKETSGKTHVNNPITFDKYNALLSGYEIKEEHDVWQPLKKLVASSGYFEGVWGMDDAKKR